MNITVLDELRAYIDPLTPDEHDALERSILAEGCRDALVLWGDILVDGHNRYGICSKHGLPFQTVQNTRFQSMEDVHLWMIDQHLGRRSVSDFQRGVLALRKKEILAARPKPLPAPLPPVSEGEVVVPPPEPRLASREAIAKAARISSATVAQIEKIQKAAAPELVEAVKTGTVSISAAATIAALPAEEQQAAVAGGKKELREAAKRVREGKAASRKPRTGEGEDGAGDPGPLPSGAVDVSDPVVLLEKQVQALQEENAQLKQRVRELETALADAARAA